MPVCPLLCLICITKKRRLALAKSFTQRETWNKTCVKSCNFMPIFPQSFLNYSAWTPATFPDWKSISPIIQAAIPSISSYLFLKMHKNHAFCGGFVHFFVVIIRHINKQLFFIFRPHFGFKSALVATQYPVNAYAMFLSLIELMLIKTQKMKFSVN